MFNGNSAIIVWELRISGTFPENTFPYTNRNEASYVKSQL